MRPSSVDRRSVRPPRARRASITRALARLPLLSLALAAPIEGCHPNRAAESAAAAQASDARGAALLPQSTITISRTGGIAGTETEATVDGAKLIYAIVARRACATGAACPPPTDVATGTIDAAAARDLFAQVDAERVLDMQEDYGTSPTLRDGFLHVVTVRRGARTKTIHGDDATLPAGLTRVEGAVLAAIDRARGR